MGCTFQSRAKWWKRRRNKEQAEAIISGNAPEPVIVLPQEESVPRVAGVTFTPQYSAKVVDLAALRTAAATDPTWADCVVPDQTRLNQLARALREQFAVPGCELVTTTSIRQTGRR